MLILFVLTQLRTQNLFILLLEMLSCQPLEARETARARSRADRRNEAIGRACARLRSSKLTLGRWLTSSQDFPGLAGSHPIEKEVDPSTTAT